MNFTPIAPTDIKGKINDSFLVKANKLLLESSKLEGSHTPQILQAVRDLLYTVNSYYSNCIMELPYNKTHNIYTLLY